MIVCIVAESSLDIGEVILFVNIQRLVGISAILIFIKLVVDAICGVVHMTILNVTEDAETGSQFVGGLHVTAVIVLIRIGVIILVFAIRQIFPAQFWISDVGDMAEMVAAESLKG